MTENETDGIAIVEIAGQGKNLLNPEVMASIVADLRAADDDADVYGIIVTGAGEAFCGGLDVPAIKAGGDPIAFARALVELLHVFPTLRTPVVAALNGDAVASGASIACAADYVVSVPTALVGTYEVSVGVWPMIAQVPIIKRVGTRAMENIGVGEPFSAQRAAEVGIVTKIVEPAELLPDARAWLERARRGGAQVAAGRPAFYELADMPYGEALDASLDKFVAMFD